MNRKTILLVMTVLCITLATFALYRQWTKPNQSIAEVKVLRGASSYTPYDALAMLWHRGGQGREMLWVASGGDAGRALVSNATTGQRPDWVLCSQGVVASLAARGEDVVIIGTVHVSSQALRPVFRRPKGTLIGSRSLYIPKSSVELAFDNLLRREGIGRESVQIPTVANIGFPTITSLLSRPRQDADALDFAVLVDPFITNLVNASPSEYEVGEGGLYDLHYSLVVRRSDLLAHRKDYLSLIRQFVDADQTLQSYRTDEDFYQNVWGRERDGVPEQLPHLITYDRDHGQLSLQTGALRERLHEEIRHFVQKYPQDLRMPQNIDHLVDPSLLREVDPSRVSD